jgi:hypothetical protein
MLLCEWLLVVGGWVVVSRHELMMSVELRMRSALEHGKE